MSIKERYPIKKANIFTEALEDLNSAISLSNGKGKSACQAFTQRAMIYRLKERDDQAKEDFQKAAELGSEFAKAQVFTGCLQNLFISLLFI